MYLEPYFIIDYINIIILVQAIGIGITNHPFPPL